MKINNYLDVTFNLNGETYKLYTKPNNSTKINKIKPNWKQQIIWFNPSFNLKTKTKNWQSKNLKLAFSSS